MTPVEAMEKATQDILDGIARRILDERENDNGPPDKRAVVKEGAGVARSTG